MQTSWKLSQDGKSASRTLDSGETESRLIVAIPTNELAQALPADSVPNPAIAEIDAKLSTIDLKSIRPAREGDTAFLATLTAQAVELRAARALLPKVVWPA